MMRLLVAALGTVAVVIAWLLWASSRDLRETWSVPPLPDPADDVQPPDPVTWPSRHHAGCMCPYCSGQFTDPLPVVTPLYGTGDFFPQPWVNTSSTQSGPIGPAA